LLRQFALLVPDEGGISVCCSRYGDSSFVGMTNRRRIYSSKINLRWYYLDSQFVFVFYSNVKKNPQLLS
ncbi:hypothetical protein, partial [Flavobacterium sp. UBA6046]|uniref:hypothetical protein n=1 Tax=Flavobacterium sp. UBA6046 TaxID=1946552 RepID=UPI0025C60056